MSWPGVAWADFSWEAFATLFTGIAAVGSASWVAIRQMDRTQRYFDAEQENRRLAIKIDLFHLRLEAIESCRMAYSEFHKYGATFSENGMSSLHSALQKSILLFTSDVNEEISEIMRAIIKARAAETRFRQYIQNEEESSIHAKISDDALFGIEEKMQNVINKMFEQTRPIE